MDATGPISEVLSRLPPHVGAAVRTAAELGRTRHMERHLPVSGDLSLLLPDGLARGTVMAVAGSAALSVTAAMVAAATAHGSWMALVDLDHAGHGALAESGVALERVVCVSLGSVVSDDVRLRAVGALVDGFDIVAIGGGLRCSPAVSRRLASRVRAELGVLIRVCDDVDAVAALGPAPDATVACGASTWQFDACARRRTVEVRVSGRGGISGRRAVLSLPPPAESAALLRRGDR